jgi:hypothetical protein
MVETLKELRAKAREMRAKVSGIPISKATKEQLLHELGYYDKADKASKAYAQRMENLTRAKDAKNAKPKSSEPKNTVEEVSSSDEEPVQKKKSSKTEKVTKSEEPTLKKKSLVTLVKKMPKVEGKIERNPNAKERTKSPAKTKKVSMLPDSDEE